MRIIVLMVLGLVCCVGAFASNDDGIGAKKNGINIYSFTMKTIDGQDKNLSDYRGKALLIVNTASQCGYTPQYKSLETLYEQYKDQGFEILAFPANNFRSQEPGSNEEIKNFCLINYKTTFLLFAKTSVVGEDINPLYFYLTTQSRFDGPITWNFNKFLIDSKGNVVARFDSKTDPLEPVFQEALVKILPQGNKEIVK